MNTISGHLLDAYPGFDGYHYLFIILFAFSVVGLIASLYLQRNIKKDETKKI